MTVDPNDCGRLRDQISRQEDRAQNLGFMAVDQILNLLEEANPRFVKVGDSWKMELTISMLHIYPSEADERLRRPPTPPSAGLRTKT